MASETCGRGPRIVHKQFNSPIGLYSPQNIQDTLTKHMQNLDNGSKGIDFNNPATNKPTNLANSAVLRMLEEEERSGHARQRKVVWPPVPETNGYHHQHEIAQHSPSSHQNAVSPPPQSSPSYQQPGYKPQEPEYQYSPARAQSAYCEGRRQEQTGLSKLIPAAAPSNISTPANVGTRVNSGPSENIGTPSNCGPPSQQAYRPLQNTRWAPVPAPVSPQGSFTPQTEYSQPPPKQFEPPPSTVTLRLQPPVHQNSPPVFPSQPATASYKGGVNMRGDQKWPPQPVRDAVAAENAARLELARGPACRPRKVKKDYTAFFAKHALNHNVAGYRVPPGTQHYEDHPDHSYC